MAIMESQITEIRRIYNEQKITDNLKLRIDFFKRNKRAPKKSNDKEEQRLYDFYRRIDLSNYENIDKSLIKENKKIDEYDLAHKDFYKRQKKIKTKQNYIIKSIKDYYDFYLKNGRFASDCNYKTKQEGNIANAYRTISSYKKYYNKSHFYYINIINDIKRKRKNRNKLLKIKRYINFCKSNLRKPVHQEKIDDAKKRYENMVIRNFEELNISEVMIPNGLLKELYDTIYVINQNNEEAKKQDLNNLLEEIIKYMQENNASCYNDTKTLINHGNSMITVEQAIRKVKENVNYIDDDLIDKYNCFSFVRKKLAK